MLPISLSLHNFLSYRDAAPTLHLDSVHVACLCGANGNGKSALLDAITWVLWGRARGQRQDQLLHHGQDEMLVELEFDVASDRYRVTRRYSRARKTPQTSLELAVLTGDSYRPITGDTIGETQAEINRRTNMDYDTFVNSAFLVQGRADMFAMATASQRKEVLSRVLGLGIYDRLEERAKLHNREAQAKLSLFSTQIDRLRERAGQAEVVCEALKEVEAQVEAAQQRASSVEQRLSLLKAQVEQLERRREEAKQIGTLALQAGVRRDRERGEAQELERRLVSWRKAESRAAEIQQGYVALHQARERLRTLNAAAQQVLTLQRELSPLDQQVTSAKAGLESEVLRLKHRLNEELTPRVQALPGAENRLAEVEKALKEIDQQSVVAVQATEQEQTLRLQARQLEQENVRIKEQGVEIRGKIDMLNHDHADGAACPVCGTELGPEGRARIEQAYNADIQDLGKRYKANAVEVTRLDAQANDIAQKAKALVLHVESERRKLDAERARLIVQRDEATKAKPLLDDVTRDIAAAEERLAKAEYAVAEQKDAKRLRERIAELAFDSHAVTNEEQTVRELEPWDAENQLLVEAQKRRPEDEASLATAHERLAEVEAEIARLTEQRDAIVKEVAELDSYREQMAVVGRESVEAGRARDELQSKRGSLLHQVEEIAAAAEALKEQEAERKHLVEEAAAYSELALAFGKGGVQALLIEAAIPRLEDEANDLLKQMTEGRMSLKLETQRARRTGRGADGSESIETLDIVISDELGTRAYEMYSGGERFRVDFALRIALSKLLAWRAGAPLPTLFIDEGFGTQDAEGRDRVLDVIKAIEDRFQRILVITHLDDIKEAFPVRIEVTRTAAGSTFSLS